MTPSFFLLIINSNNQLSLQETSVSHHEILIVNKIHFLYMKLCKRHFVNLAVARAGPSRAETPA